MHLYAMFNLLSEGYFIKKKSYLVKFLRDFTLGDKQVIER